MQTVSNFLIDIGNSACKALFSEGIILGDIYRHFGDECLEFLESLLKDKSPDTIVVSSVREDNQELSAFLHTKCKKVIFLRSDIELPIKNLYDTPETLGADRIASAVAAQKLFPNKGITIFDFGTALTVDFVNIKGEYIGGNISLGLKTRFKSLNHFTKRLPLVENPMTISKIGRSTHEAIQSGVVLGIIYEVEGYINENPENIIIFTGGDAIYFAEKMKNSIFVVHNLVLMGLSQIANYYANN